jgi:hypothetical protein
VLWWATIAAGVCVLPAVVRCAPLVGGLSAWWVLWGSASLVAGPVAVAWLSAWPWPRLVWAIPLGLLFSAPLLTAFAEILHRSTHHRPLGAATFAVLGVAVLLSGLVAVMRLLAASQRGRRFNRLARVLIGLGVGLAVLVELALVRSAIVRGGDWMGDAALDSALLTLAAAMGAWLPTKVRAPRRWGPMLWGVAVTSAVVWLALSSSARAALTVRAPVLVGVTRGLGLQGS